MKRMWWLVAMIAAVTLSTSPAFAQEEKKDREPGVIDLGELTVEGKVQKPQVFYVLGRSEFRYQGLKLERSFVQQILKSAKKNPF